MNRKKDKGEEILESTYDELTLFENFFKTHWKRIVICGFAVVVLIAVFVLVKNWLESKDTEAVAELSKADTIEELESVLKKFPRHKTSDYARIRLGRRYFESGNYQKALDIFSALAKNAKYEDLRAQAALNEACTLEEMGKVEESAEKYAQIGRAGNVPAEYRAEANCQAARIYITLNKSNLAKACLDLVEARNLQGGESNQHYEKAQILKSLL